MKHLLLTLFFFFPFLLFSQKPYFQQEVNYRIAVSLDDKAHTLSGNIEIEYVNHSPDVLPEIWIHLWGNAFKNRRTAFCRQKLEDGNARFYFADEKDLGYYKNLDFTVDGQKTAWQYDPQNPDIAVLTLPTPLLPGRRIAIATPFTLKIPASFSRLGRVGTSYQMTQWYPKPAVYDRKGWHAMPYLDMGEFFSEFGSFDVTITLPDNYVVGATGVLQTPSEIEFLTQKEVESKRKLFKSDRNGRTESDSFPVSSPRLKTIRYTAGRVHDFAWFADKRFYVLKDTAHLASGRRVECWAMFPPSRLSVLKTASSDLWKKGAFYVRRAVEFYSRHVGEYPYPQATAVHSALSAGGGMEYPMITVIGDERNAKGLDDVIAHEVGHNWFYGILASNERDHPWMDEGINSYYENRYMKQYYGSMSIEDALPKGLFNPAESGSLIENGYLLLARDRKDTPPDTRSELFAPLAYGIQAYMKTALCFNWLEKSIGAERLDAAMQDYYRQWQFRHPYPEDLKAVFQQNGLDAEWFFQSLQTRKRADFALKSIKENKEDGSWSLEIENKRDLNAPFPVTALKGGKALETKWFSAPGEVVVPAAGADAFVIDYEHHTLDLNRKNNLRRTGGFLPGFEPAELKVLTPFQRPGHSTLGLFPWIGWNNYDKTMIGAVLYNPPLPPRRLQYYLAPGFATGSKRFVGLADLRLSLFPGGLFPKIIIGASAKSFHFDYNWPDGYYSKFYRVVPQIRAELRDNAASFRHFLNLRTVFLGKESAARDSGVFTGKYYSKYEISELRYEAEQRKYPNPWHFSAAIEWQKSRDEFSRLGQYWRGSLEWKQRFFYSPKRKVTLRMFAGGFLQNDRRNDDLNAGDPAYGSFALNPQGFNDYRFDQVFLARSGSSGILGRQVSQTEGGFKGAFGAAFARQIGNSNNYILALNLKADLPQRLPLGLPLKPWFDLGYYDDAAPTGSGGQVLWSGGLMLELFDGGLEIYFPLVNSKTLRNRYLEAGGAKNDSAIFGGGNYFKWISWSIRLDNAEPSEILESLVR